MDRDETELADENCTSGKNVNKACESCRNSKIRCIVESVSPDGSCKRCLTTGRSCVFNAPRIRQRRRLHGDIRVAELEKQLRSLKMELDRAHQWIGEQGLDAMPRTAQSSTATEAASNSTSVRFEAPVTLASWPKKSDLVTGSRSKPSTQISSQAIKETHSSLDPSDTDTQVNDVVTRKKVSWTEAQRLVGLYFSDFASKYPFVTVPSYSTAAELRLHRPATFLAIITAASTVSSEELNKTLTRELLVLITRRVMLDGEHSLDLAQAMILLAIWYSTLERFQSLQHYQFAHLAATIAMDIDPAKNRETLVNGRLGDEDLDRLRSVLSIYTLSAGISLTSGRPKMLRLTDNYIENSLAQLEAGQNGNDQWFIAWVRLQHLTEKTTERLFVEDRTGDIYQSPNQEMVADFCHKLDSWRRNLNFKLEGGLAVHYFYARSLVLSVCLHGNHDVSNFRPPYRVWSLEVILRPFCPLTPFFVRTVMALMDNVHAALDAFLSFDVQELHAAPFVYYLRTAFSLTILLTLDLVVRRPGNELSQILDPDILKIGHYLQAFQQAFRSASEHGTRQEPAKYLVIVQRMERWWRSQFQPGALADERSKPLTVLPQESTKMPDRRANSSKKASTDTTVTSPPQSPGHAEMHDSLVAEGPGPASLTPPRELLSSNGEDLYPIDWVLGSSPDLTDFLPPEIDWTFLDSQPFSSSTMDPYQM